MKICPLYKTAIIITLGGDAEKGAFSLNDIKTGYANCDGEACAWWDSDYENCSLRCLGRLHELAGFLGGK